MGILDRAKQFVTKRPIATGMITYVILFITDLPITAFISAAFIGSGAANATIKYITAKVIPFIWGNKQSSAPSSPNADVVLSENTLRFTDKDDAVLFEYHGKFPSQAVKVRIPASDGHEAETYSVNPDALLSYLIYRRELVRSHSEKKDLAIDIKYPKRHLASKQYRVPEIVGVSSYKAQVTNKNQPAKGPLNRAERGLNDNSIAIALDSIQRWKDPNEKMQSFVAYKNVNYCKLRLGFVLFQQKEVDGRPIIYIAEAAVAKRGDSIGRRLMECVLARFPIGTEFHILTRKFNTDAINLYEHNLGFEPLSKDDVAKLGYNNDRYIGYKHISNGSQLDTIKAKQSNFEKPRVGM